MCEPGTPGLTSGGPRLRGRPIKTELTKLIYHEPRCSPVAAA
jgi:hypothetical protein